MALLAALLALTLTLATRAQASYPPSTIDTIGRANLDGTGVDQNFISNPTPNPCGVAVDAEHVYWANSFSLRAIGRANLDGSGAEPDFIAGARFPCGVAVNARHVYWANSSPRNTIGRARLDGTRVNQRFIAGADAPCGMAVDAAHVYWANAGRGTIGRAKLDGSGVDQSFIAGANPNLPCGVAVDALPFSFGKLKRNRKQGTAKLTVNVPGPGALELAKTRRIKGAKKRAQAEGSAKLPVKPKRVAKKKLARRGKAKVKAIVSFVPDDGEGGTLTKPLKLIKRR